MRGGPRIFPALSCHQVVAEDAEAFFTDIMQKGLAWGMNAFEVRHPCDPHPTSPHRSLALPVLRSTFWTSPTLPSRIASTARRRTLRGCAAWRPPLPAPTSQCSCAWISHRTPSSRRSCPACQTRAPRRTTFRARTAAGTSACRRFCTRLWGCGHSTTTRGLLSTSQARRTAPAPRRPLSRSASSSRRSPLVRGRASGEFCCA